MNKSREPDELDIAALLQKTGSRETPSSKMMADVQAAVHSEWQAVVRKRHVHRRRTGLIAAAAGVATVAVATLFTISTTFAPAPTQVATIDFVDGVGVVSNRAPTVVGRAVMTGESLTTGADGLVSLRWPSGMSVRLDHGTRITLAAADRIELNAGGVYVDAAAGRSDPLTIESALGRVQHRGTQYEVRAQPQALQISIREGRVAIRYGRGMLDGNAGDRIRLQGQGAIEQTRISATDAAWLWTTRATSPFQIDRQPLADFLDWLGRETGRRVVFATPGARSAATETMLRGSIEGLDLDNALSTVLASTRLRQYRTDDDSLGIELQGD